MLRWKTLNRAVTLALTASAITSCGAQLQEARPGSPLIASPQLPPASILTSGADYSPMPTSVTLAARYAFPTQIDPTRRYLFYLHGKILEDQGLPAISREFGEYQYEEILGVLENYGFVVVSEQRLRNADGWEYAQRTSRQVANLLEAGVPPGSITVTGASKGAAIAVATSYLVGNTEVNYFLLATCHPSLIDEWRQQGLTLSGNVLAIYDFADEEYSGSCEELFNLSEEKGLSHHEEILLLVGTGHGILYEPLPEWILPTIRWASQQW